MRRPAVIGLIATLLAGCWEFVEPDFPQAGAAAVLQVTANVNERGAGTITALLVPGLTIGGFARDVPNDSLFVNGMRLAPSNVRANGTREYVLTGDLGATPLDTDTPLEIRAPAVQDLPGLPPEIRWYTIRKIDPDTLSWTPGSDLILNVETTLAPSQPFPQIRQWFLDISGSDRSFRLSSDGLPPSELRIPPEFIPAPSGDRLTVSMSFYQAATYPGTGNNYVGNYSFTVRLNWIVKVNP